MKMLLQIDEVFVNIGRVRYLDSGAQPPLLKEFNLGIHNETFRDVTHPAGLVKDIVFLILRKAGLSSMADVNFDMLFKGVSGELSSTIDQLSKRIDG